MRKRMLKQLEGMFHLKARFDDTVIEVQTHLAGPTLSMLAINFGVAGRSPLIRSKQNFIPLLKPTCGVFGEQIYKFQELEYANTSDPHQVPEVMTGWLFQCSDVPPWCL